MKLLETMMYVGANRRSKRTGFEHLVQMEPEECAEIERVQANLHERLANSLQAAGADSISESFLQPATGMSPACVFVHWYGSSTVALQRSAGHDVGEFQVIPSEKPDHCRIFYDFEHGDVAREASRLALGFIASLIPALQLEEDLVTTDEDQASLYSAFRKYSAERLLPRDTQAIIDACERLDIPYIKLDRDPYKGITGPFRIRKNGMLKLGHSCYQQIVDGTVCVDRSDINSPLRSDRDAIFASLTRMNLPVAEQDLMFRNLTRASRAQRSADKIGYPVVVKPNLRGHREGVTLNITDGQALSTAVQTEVQGLDGNPRSRQR